MKYFILHENFNVEGVISIFGCLIICPKKNWFADDVIETYMVYDSLIKENTNGI
jgi:hypothetical protein